MPEMSRYIGTNGEFHTARFAIHAALRPAIWPTLARLKRNSDIAIEALCKTLARFTAAREVDVILSRARAS
jgi:hypothetical protein